MPEVRHIILHTLKHGQFAWQERRRIGLELRSHAYQQAIVLPSSWKSALIPFFANIPKRTGYIGEMRYGLLNDMRQLDKSILPRTIERFVALGFFTTFKVKISAPTYFSPLSRCRIWSRKMLANGILCHLCQTKNS